MCGKLSKYSESVKGNRRDIKWEEDQSWEESKYREGKQFIHQN